MSLIPSMHNTPSEFKSIYTFGVYMASPEKEHFQVFWYTSFSQGVKLNSRAIRGATRNFPYIF